MGDEIGDFGFKWGPVSVQRWSKVERSNGTYYCIGIVSDVDQIEVYVSPTGKLRVFRSGKGELRVKKDA